MTRKAIILTTLSSAMLITLLFHKQAFGLNLLIAETILFIWLTGTGQFRFKGLNAVTAGIGLLLTCFFTVFTYSAFCFIIHFFTLLIFAGILVYPQARSLVMTIGLSLTNLFNSQIRFVKEITATSSKGRKLFGFIWKMRIFLIPAFVILLFIMLYKNANPVFDELVMHVSRFINKYWMAIFRDFDFLVIITFMIALLISNVFFSGTTNEQLVRKDLLANDELLRIKKKKKDRFNTIGLKNEYKAGVFLLVVLNVLLLVLNAIDIYWVWFNFEWQGQYLRQFVHEGTYLLIISLIISIALVLYFFRGNQNFYTRNKLLRTLGYVWLLQNGILAISVAIRNFWYIHYFALAYKRIGVIIFLILTIYGLYTVLIKVRMHRSFSYLLKKNIYFLYVVLVISSIINWDSIIARYNFRHANRSFLHLDYMVTLSDKTLPLLDKPMTELNRMDSMQKDIFSFDGKPMTPVRYHSIIDYRKKLFIKKWEGKNSLSWNWPEYRAYEELVASD